MVRIVVFIAILDLVSGWSLFDRHNGVYKDSCDQVMHFRDAAANFLNDTDIESTKYNGMYWDTRWRPYHCPKVFPYFACLIANANVTTSCLQNTLCSYDPAAIAPNATWKSLQGNFTKRVDYTPRALFYRSDQNLVQENVKKTWVAPRYRFRSGGEHGSFALHSITIAFAARTVYDLVVPDGPNVTNTTPGTESNTYIVTTRVRSDIRARSIVARGYKLGINPDLPLPNGEHDYDIAIFNVTFPDLLVDKDKDGNLDIVTAPVPSYTKFRYTSTLPQTPIMTDPRPTGVVEVYPPPTVVGVVPGVADPQIYLRYEFPHNPKVKFTQWSNLGTVEISAYRDYVDFNEDLLGHKHEDPNNPVVPLPGEFYLKAVNISQNVMSGRCSEQEEEIY